MPAFVQLLERVRAGDDQAATELFRTYEPHVKRLVRHLMRIATVRAAADPSDVCQSVMASFFIRAALGEYDISSPEKLMNLLKRMARNKVVDLQRAQGRRVSFFPIKGPGVPGVDPPDPDKGPASTVVVKDLLEEIRRRLTSTERQVSDMRAQGLSWDEIGDLLGEPADAPRKRLKRGLERLSGELNLEG